MRDLRLYRHKRDPEGTPEPFGDLSDQRPLRGLAPDAPRRFVVQQHDATRMHWDLRLEIDGVLVSWAIPRGPSLDPSEKRLAVQTEDHPLEYADFEGLIPTGNYGAGAMIVWDHGVYRSVDGNSPAEGLEVGKIDLRLAGSKLQGRFALVRTSRNGEKEWLFFRKGDPPEEGGDLIDRLPGSVFSGLTVQELGEGETRDRSLSKQLRREKMTTPAPAATTLRPMLTRTRKTAFRDPGWIFELKYDGVRILAEKQDGEVRLFARTGGERTHVYPEIATALRHLAVASCVIDGEIVALDERGQSSFERIQRRFTQTDPDSIARHVTQTPVVFYAFDVLALGGKDLCSAPLLKRKEWLAEFVPTVGTVRYADHVVEEGLSLFEMAEAHDLEGIVAKRADSAYQPGRRSDHWCKIKVPRSACLAIVGIARGKGSRRSLGSVMLAGWRNGQLCYVGNAGSGLGEDVIDHLLEEADRLERPTPPMEGGPEAWPEGARFLEPELFCEVRYTEVTSNGTLRHPVFLGLKSDLSLEEAHAPGESSPPEPEPALLESPAAPEAELRLTRLDKVFWPDEGITKGDLLAYYEAVWPWLSPYLKDRPLVLTRYPDGVEGKYFFQKNVPDFTPSWVQREQIDGTDSFICNDLKTLLYVINSGAIPLHVWSARVGDLEHPDWLTLDLDPKGAPFEDVIAIARHIHRLLDELGAEHFVKTSGQDGVHIMLPLGGQLDHQEARTLAEAVARTVAADLPEIATVTRPVARRGGKVYIDFLQNIRGQLMASPLSVRPRAGAPVSMPLVWGQVTKRLDPSRWNLQTAVGRLRRQGDPFVGVLHTQVDVPALLTALSTRLERGPSAG